MSRFSRSCLVGAGALLLTLSRPAELPADTFIRGDSNLDRTIDITDAVSLLGCLYLGQACASCEDASDANDDGSLDLSDAVYTLAFAFLGGVAPRPPHPAPGPDPTADLLTCERGLGPEPVRIEVDPPALELAPLEEVQLQVTAVFSDAATSVVIAGQAPLEVETFRLNGAALTPTRVGIAGWSFTRSIPLGETVFLVEGLDGTGAVVSSDSIRVLRVPPCVPASLEPAQAPAGPSVAIIVHGSGFVPGSSPKVRLTSASGESGFNALYVQAPGSFGGGAEAMDNAVALLNNPASAQRSLSTTHLVINLTSNGGGAIFPSPAKFPAPWNGDPSNFAARYTGFINVPSPGTRTFGVHSDDGFRLTIAGSRVAEWPQPRAPATSIGDFNFPAAGSYPIVLEWYENAGGDLVELFQSDPSGGQALLNSGSELGVTVDDSQSIPASTTVVEDAATIRCTFDLTTAAPGVWNLAITPEQGSDCTLKAALTVE